MTAPPNSTRRYVAGPTGSGKSHLLRVWAEKHRRQLVLDATGEWASPETFDGTVVWASSRAELNKSLRDVSELPRWRVVLPTDRLEPEELIELLVPMHRPGRSSFPRAVGGLALIVDEAAELAPDNPRAVRALWLRGRHHGLSILAASQRPADVGRAVTSQSELVAITMTDEPIDLAFWRGFLRGPRYEALLELELWQAVLVDRVERTASVITTAGELVREIGPAV